MFHLFRYFHLIKNSAHLHRKKYIIFKIFLYHITQFLKLIQETINLNRISTKTASIYPKINNHLTTELPGWSLEAYFLWRSISWIYHKYHNDFENIIGSSYRSVPGAIWQTFDELLIVPMRLKNLSVSRRRHNILVR